MELIDAKCPNCGSEIKIDKNQKSGVCTHCNSNFLIEDAVKNYITNNSYNINHATIIKSDFSDDVLYNEVDKYIAQFELNNVDKLDDIVEELKTKFPHKGLARIVILHYEFSCLILTNGTEDDFNKEYESIEEVCKNYNPKSYKHTPPISKYFLDDTENIEIQYADEIESMLSEEEKNRYPELIERTLDYTNKYLFMFEFNKQMYQKFEPIKDKLEKKANKIKKKRDNIQKKAIIKFSIIIVSIILIITLLSIMFVRTYFLTERPFSNASNINYLESPKITEISSNISPTYKEIGKNDVAIYYSKEFSISGRVIGKRTFLPLDIDKKIMTTSICLGWGELTSKEKTKKIEWKCSLLTGEIDYSWNPSLGDEDFVYNYSSTNKLIPADDYVATCLRTIRKNDIVQINGYLVNVISTSNKGKIDNWSTSLSINDETPEIIYVTSVTWLR